VRDPARISRIIEKLRAAWMSSPDLRLGQLVTNLGGVSRSYKLQQTAAPDEWPIEAHHCTDPFYVEDSELEAALDAFLSRKA
jgi:hypothetical protein